MEINGITFENWAAASANIANGMSIEEVCQILRTEIPVWEDTNTQWGEKLADLMTSDMNMAMKYGEIFQNPKVGKFANVGETVSMDDVLKEVPDYDTFMKITMHQSKATKVGLDAGTIITEYGLTLQQWGQVGMHYSSWVKDKIHEENATPEEMEMFNDSDKKWAAHFEDFYKEQEANLGEDIDF